MLRRMRIATFVFALCVVLRGLDGATCAGTIIGLGGGGLAVSIQYNGTTLSTPGPQDSQVDFGGLLDWYPDIVSPPGSFTLDGVTRSGSATVFGSLIIQQFTGGTFSLYDASHTLLLSGGLTNTALSGTAGLKDNGLLTTSFSTTTGGTLAPYIDPTSLVLQMHLSNINSGAGLSTVANPPPVGNVLQPFTAGVMANINGNQIPEPKVGALLLVLLALILSATRRTHGFAMRG